MASLNLRLAERLRLNAGESIFIPRKTAHILGAVEGAPGRIINVYQPAGKMEEFFRELSNFEGLPTREDVLNNTVTEEQVNGLRRLFSAYGDGASWPTAHS